MLTLGPIGFTAPIFLVALIVLPLLWLLLRAIPPAPIQRRFPGVALLLGLTDEQVEADKTPWWLLLLRMAIAALVILGVSGPVLNPEDRVPGTAPLLVLADGTWAGASDWGRRQAKMSELIAEAGRDGRAVALATATDLPAGGPQFQGADAALSRLAGQSPAPYQPDDLAAWVAEAEGAFDTYWLSDGLTYEGHADALSALSDKGAVTVFQTPRPTYALRPARFDQGNIVVELIRARPTVAAVVTVAVVGRDPAGIERTLSELEMSFAAGEALATAEVSLPAELRNRLTRLVVQGTRSAGAVTITDDSLKRREVALISGRDDREGLELLSPLHFLEQALVPTADILNGAVGDVLAANPDALILADVAQVPAADEVLAWVEEGGLLVRFAGPRLAGADTGRDTLDPLLPVRLRAGGRSIGGAMSWGEPKRLRPFPPESPFFGLPVPDDISVNAQVLAQPDPDLADRVLASLADGTPFVTRRAIGEGQVVLFHVTANAEWSSIPLSGLYVSMLERLAISTRSEAISAENLAGTVWEVEQVLDGFGELDTAPVSPGVPGEVLAERALGPDLMPGLYASGDQRIALNVVGADDVLTPVQWPATIPVEGLDVSTETPLEGYAFMLALGLGLADALAALWLSGRLFGPRVAAALAAIFLVSAPWQAEAQSADELALIATSDVVLAHVLTGDRRLDETAAAGLEGLSRVLFRRTSIEPVSPIGLDLETAELSLFPFIYWPISPEQPLPSDVAYAKLNRYLQTGGMILFDTRDADRAQFGASSPEGRRLQELAQGLDIPPLEPVPSDHVLTRAFYLLQDFPGRHAGRDVWVEAAPADAEFVEGMPFRNLNDGVTPIVAGGNDWAAAWAVDEAGRALYPVGRGFAGERQRELAYRFGVNLIMHVLTGNYKSDQVHVPALLDRLGQ